MLAKPDCAHYDHTGCDVPACEYVHLCFPGGYPEEYKPLDLDEERALWEAEYAEQESGYREGKGV